MAKRNDCRFCGGTRLERFLELGPTPLANRFVAPDKVNEPEPIFPLDVYFCQDCSLVQLLDVVPPEVLFRDYIYVTGTSDTMRKHFAAEAEMVHRRFLKPGSLVVEVASNDGTLLSNFLGKDVRALGIEPARNIAAIARKKGVETIDEFFGQPIAEQVAKSHGKARAILANNVFAHVDDTTSFVKGVDALLEPEGVFVFEASWVFDMIDHLEFDSVYHEHLCYISATAVHKLFQRHGMEVFDVEHVPTHGGSLRVFVQRQGGPHAHTGALQRWLDEEERRGVMDPETYRKFAARVHELRRRVVALLKDLRAQGKKVVAYGSSAKGNTLLNYMQIGTDLVDYVVDRSPMKQGLFTPGMKLPVYDPHRLETDRPDFALLLAWNFLDEVLAQQETFRKQGGKFIVPMPEPRIVPA